MKEKKVIKTIVIFMIILILLALNLYIFIINNQKENMNKEEPASNSSGIENYSLNNIETEETDEKNRKEKIASLSEKLRMQTYFGEYISYIENEKYEEAYNLLFDEFKNNYFQSLNTFITYAKEKYPNNIVVEYTDLNREGNIYILEVKIKDALSTNNEDAKTTNVVIRENDIDDFQLSFEVQE